MQGGAILTSACTDLALRQEHARSNSLSGFVILNHDRALQNFRFVLKILIWRIRKWVGAYAHHLHIDS
jgi:hypothetical protein